MRRYEEHVRHRCRTTERTEPTEPVGTSSMQAAVAPTLTSHRWTGSGVVSSRCTAALPAVRCVCCSDSSASARARRGAVAAATEACNE